MPFQKDNSLAAGGARANAGRKSNAARNELRQILDAAVPASTRRQIFKAMALSAKNGDMAAAKILLGYLYGNPVNRHQFEDLADDELIAAVIGDEEQDAGDTNAA